MFLFKAKFSKALSAIFSLLYLCVVSESFAQSAAPSDLDLSFGNAGKIVTAVEADQEDSFGSVLIQTDGKIILTGAIRNSFRDMTLARYNPDGTPDADFGNNGVVITDVGGSDWAIASAQQADGKIVVAGRIGLGRYHFGVVRYNQDGSLDTSFDGDGKLTTDVTGFDNEASAIAVQADGKIIVSGSCGWSFCMVRYNPNGALDPSFGDNGKVVTPTTITERSSSIVLQPDGKIILGGYASLDNGNYQFMAARYQQNGTLDLGFDGDGKVMTSVNGFQDFGSAVALQPDGKIIMAGSTYRRGDPFRPNIYTDYDAAVIRYNSNGSLDTTFDGDGKTSLHFTPENQLYFDGAGAVAVQKNGKILIGGYSWNGSRDTFTLARFHPDGSLDAGFGIGGKVKTAVRNITDQAFDIALQRDGKILLAGLTSNPFNNDLAVIRFMGDPVSAQNRNLFDFDGDGKSDISVFRPSDGTWYLNRSSQGFTAAQFGASGDKIAPADFDGDGKTDFAVFRDNTWYLLRSTLGFTAVQFGESGDVPQPTDFDGDGRAELAVFRQSNGSWYVLNLVNNQFTAVQFGASNDKPVAADYDGDGKADYAVYRPTDGTWYMFRSQQGFTGVQFGISTDKPVVGDYDGDGKSDPAVYRDGIWYLLRSSQGFTAVQFGIQTDTPAPADYDGDGKTDPAVYRDNTWYLLQSTNGFTGVQFGAIGDKPVPNAFVP